MEIKKVKLFKALKTIPSTKLVFIYCWVKEKENLHSIFLNEKTSKQKNQGKEQYEK